MSHSTRIGRYTFIHNADFSGDVEITHDRAGGVAIVPSVVLIEFVAEMVRREREAELENATPAQLLGLRR